MSLVHELPIEIGMRHCDPAGIVFYPCYIEMLHDTVEHWLNHGLKIGVNNLHTNRNLGIPMVNLQVDFHSPGRLGDLLTSKLSIKRLGRSSMQMQVHLCGPDDAVRVEGRLTVVFADLEKISSVSIPDDIRALIEPYLDAEEA